MGHLCKKRQKIIVDIDAAELNKHLVPADLAIHADAKAFLNQLSESLPQGFAVDPQWAQWCLLRKHKYPVVLEEYKQPPGTPSTVHPYWFIDRLTAKTPKNTITVAANGTACVVLFQAGIVKKHQRTFWNSGCAGMGYALPASIGAALASNKEVICLTGDGSIQMNLQELQTIKEYKLPIKIIILNNQGYQSIIQTQTTYFQADYIGCNSESRVSFPDFSKLADLYDLNYFKIDSLETMEQQIEQVLAQSGGLICEVMLCDYAFSPRLSSEKLPDGTMVSKPLEDLFPFLDREELASNMIVKPAP